MECTETHRLQKGDFGKVMHIDIFEMDNQQTYCIAYETLFNVMRQPGWGGLWGRMETCICMAESLHCSPEMITILLVGCTPVQNHFGV